MPLFPFVTDAAGAWRNINVGRTQRALTSLIAAIPAGFLSYLLVMVFLKQADSLNTTLKVIVGVSLLCAAIITLMPFGLLIFGGKKSVSSDEKPSRGKSDDLDEDLEDVAEVDEDGESVEGADEELAESSSFDMDDDDADVMADSDDAISTISGNDSSLDEIETADDFEDAFEDEDEPKPKKKKR
jgi:hypothetical protein